MFSLRIVATNHYLAPPIKGLDIERSEFRDSSVKKVPVLQIFGATPAGQKTCMHIHGVFPYLYVPYDGTQPEDRFLRQFAMSLDRALNIANGSSNSNLHHVYKISIVSGIPMYGYHPDEEHFLKIYFYNPNSIKKAAELLLGGAVMNKPYQPHDSHISYPLQVFIDYNLYGMNFINVAALKFRNPLIVSSVEKWNVKSSTLAESHKQQLLSSSSNFFKIWTVENISDELCLPASVRRQSSCELEIDVVAADIINIQDLANPGSSCINQGLAALWENIKEGTKDEIMSQEFNRDQGANIVLADSEKKHLVRFREIVIDQQALSTSQLSQTSSADHSEDNRLQEDNASLQNDVLSNRQECPVINVPLIKKIVSCSQSFTKSQGTTSDSQDMSVTNILASLLDESTTLFPSQIASLEEQDCILTNSILLTEQDELEDEAETQSMTNAMNTSVEDSKNLNSCLENKLGDHQDVSDAVEMCTDEEDSDSEVDLLPQFDGASDKIPASDQKNSKSQNQVPSSVNSGDKIVTESSETPSDVSNNSGNSFRNGTETASGVSTSNSGLFSDGSDTSSGSGVNNSVFSDGSESSPSNSTTLTSQSYNSGNKTWSQVGWSQQSMPWSGEYLGWTQSQSYQHWNQRSPAGYSPQRTTSCQTLPHSVYSSQQSFKNSSPQYQYPHYTSPSREQQFQQCYQSPPHMPYQSQAPSQSPHSYQPPATTLPYNSTSHYMSSVTSKPYQPYQVPQVEQSFRPFPVTSPSQSPRSDIFNSSTSQQSPYSTTDLGEGFPLQSNWAGSHVSSHPVETNRLSQISNLNVQSVDRANLSFKEEEVTKIKSPKLKQSGKNESLCRLNSTEQNIESKTKLENSAFINSTAADLSSQQRQGHHASIKAENIRSPAYEPLADTSLQQLKSEIKNSFSPTRCTGDDHLAHLQHNKSVRETSTCTEMSSFNPSAAVHSTLNEESTASEVHKSSSASVGVNTSTPMMQQLLMEDSTVRMVIKKETRESSKKTKSLASPDLPKPKKKYVSRSKQSSKTNSRPRSTSLSTFPGHRGFSPNPGIHSQIRSERAHSISFPFNNEPSFSGALPAQNSRWLQHQPELWNDPTYSHTFSQPQWDANQWQNSRPLSGFNDNSANMFQHKPYLPEPLSKSQYHQNPQLHCAEVNAMSPPQSNIASGHCSAKNQMTTGNYDKSSLSSLFQLVSDMNTSSEDNNTQLKNTPIPHDVYVNEKQTPISDVKASEVSYTCTKDFITLEAPNKSTTITESENKESAELNANKLRIVSQPKIDYPCLGKQSRLKRLGIIHRSGNEESSGLSPNFSYTYTFHVPTPVFKKLKFHLGEDARKHKVNIVRMHPMDARRYSLLKIGREIVKISKLTEEDLAKYRVYFPVQTLMTSSDGSTNRVNLNIPTVSVDKISGDTNTETNSLSKFDTDFPPNKVAPPSSFLASQLIASRVRSNSSSFRNSQGITFNRNVSGTNDQRTGFSFDQNYSYFYPANVNPTSYSSQTPLSPENGSSYGSCQDYPRSQYYYQQLYGNQQQPYFHQMQQSSSPQTQEYNSTETESKNELRSPVQHGTSTIDSGCAMGHSGQATGTSPINNRVNAGNSDSHAENLASNQGADMLNVHDKPQNIAGSCSNLHNDCFASELNVSKNHCNKYVNKKKKLKGKRKRHFFKKFIFLSKKTHTGVADVCENHNPENVLDTSKPKDPPANSSHHLVAHTVTSEKDCACLFNINHQNGCTASHLTLQKTLKKKFQPFQQESKRLLRNLSKKFSCGSNNVFSSDNLLKKQHKKRERKALKEGVHYVIVGKFKGHQLMLVRIKRVNVQPNESVNAALFEARAVKDIVRKAHFFSLGNIFEDVRSDQLCQCIDSSLSTRFIDAPTPCEQQLLSHVNDCKNVMSNFIYQNESSPKLKLAGNDIDIPEDGRKDFECDINDGSFFCRFQECYLRHREARNMPCMSDMASHHLFFKDVKHSFFKSFQVKFVNNMNKHTNDYYSSSSDDEDDYLDAIIIKEKIRNPDGKDEKMKSSDSFDGLYRLNLKMPSESYQNFLLASSNPAEDVPDKNKLILLPDWKKANNKSKCEENITIECEKWSAISECKSEALDEKACPIGLDLDKDKSQKDDFLTRQMAFFEDISSDSDSGDTIIMYNLDKDSEMKSSMPCSEQLEVHNRSPVPSVTLDVSLDEAGRIDCGLLKVNENKLLVPGAVSDLRVDDLGNFSARPLVEDDLDTHHFHISNTSLNGTNCEVKQGSTEFNSELNPHLEISDSLELSVNEHLSDSKQLIKRQNMSSDVCKPGQKYFKRNMSSGLGIHFEGNYSKDFSSDKDSPDSIEFKDDDPKNNSDINSKGKISNLLISNDEVNSLTESKNKCLRQKKRIKYVFYSEELTTSDSSYSSSEDFERSMKSRKSKKENKNRKIRKVDVELNRKIGGHFSDDCKQAKSANKSRSSRGKRKKTGDGKLLKSLSLLHMATLANLTEMQGDYLDLPASSSDLSLHNETLRLGTSNSSGNATPSFEHTLSHTASEVNVFPSSSNQKKSGNERTSERLMHRSLKPGCNGASNLGSRPLPISRLSSSSPVPSNSFLNTSDSLHHIEQLPVIEDSGVANTLHLLETRKAQVNCASFSMKDILRLATSEDSLDSDSIDSMPLIRPPKPRRAQVKSATLSMSDIAKLTSVDISPEKTVNEISSFVPDNERLIHCNLSGALNLKPSFLERTRDKAPVISHLLPLSSCKLSETQTYTEPLESLVSSPLSLIDNVKSSSNLVSTFPEYIDREVDSNIAKSKKLGKNKCNFTSMKENSFQEPMFIETHVTNCKPVKSCLTSAKSTSLKEIQELCNVSESVNNTQNISPDSHHTNLDRCETLSDRWESTTAVNSSACKTITEIPRIAITCDETAIQDEFKDAFCKTNENIQNPEKAHISQTVNISISEISPNNCLSCLQTPPAYSANNLSTCKKCHNNYSPITPTSPMSPVDQTSSEMISPPIKKTKPLWYPWLITKSNLVESNAENCKTFDALSNKVDTQGEGREKNSNSKRTCVQNQENSLKSMKYNSLLPLITSNYQASTQIVGCAENVPVILNKTCSDDGLVLSQNLPVYSDMGKKRKVSKHNPENSNTTGHILNIPGPFSPQDTYYLMNGKKSQYSVQKLIEEPLNNSHKKTLQNCNSSCISSELNAEKIPGRISLQSKIKQNDNPCNKNETAKNKRILSDQSARVIQIRPLKSPPSCKSVISNLHDLGFHMLHSPKAFCSNHEDLSDCPKELLGRVFKLESNRISSLTPFTTFHQLDGISEWQSKCLSVSKLLSQSVRKSFKNTLLEQPELKSILTGNENIKLLPVIGPPQISSVEKWLLGKLPAVGNFSQGKQVSLPQRISFVPTVKDSQGQITLPEDSQKTQSIAKITVSQEKEKRTKMITLSCSSTPLLKSRRNSENLNLSHSQHHPYSFNSLSGDVSQIDGPSPLNTFNFKVQKINLKDPKVLHKCQNVTVMSLELHIDTRGDLKPDPEFDPVQAVFFSVQDDAPVEQRNRNLTGILIIDKDKKDEKLNKSLAQSSLFVRDKFSSNDKSQTTTEYGLCNDVEVLYVENETELIDMVIQIVRSLDPDILIGYEIQMLSWGYLLQRASKLKIDLQSGLARVQVLKENKVRSDEELSTSDLRVTGRIVLNLWQILRHEVALNIYTFENAAYHILHHRIPLYSFHSLTSWYKAKDLQRWRVIEYYLQRVTSELEMMVQLDIIGKTSEFARIYGIEFYDVLSRGSQIRVESMMLRFAKAQNYVCVSPSINQRAHQRAPECIPLTLEPESKYYTSPVVVLDFQSLYPSIMIAYNYCYSTCLGRLNCLEKINEGSFEFGCTSLNINASTLQKVQEQVTISPNGVAFVKSTVRKGVLPKMLEEILCTRLMVKKSMKVNKDDKDLFRMLNARQLGLKLISNVTYGYTGASFSGRMPCIEVGDSIVRKARESLERAIEMVRNTPKWKAHVVYGDTDSLFIHFPGCTKEEAFVLGNEIADTITDMFPSPMKLKFEKVYLPCVLQTKKRYFGYMYETPDQKEPTFDAKGIETVRRDSCSAVSKILERTIKVLFTTHDLSRVKIYVTRQLHKLLEGKVSLHDFIFAKEFRGMMGYKPAACVPSLEIARRRVRIDRRSEPRIGERVPYVVVNGSPGLPLIQLVREPAELICDVTLRLNVDYYIMKQILPPLDRIFLLIGINVYNWYQNMPKVIRLAPVMNFTNTAKQGIISQFYASVNCPVCDIPTKRPICDGCCKDSQGVVFKLTTKMHNWEKTYFRLTQICTTCQGIQDKEQKCISLDCPILYRRNTAQQDMLNLFLTFNKTRKSFENILVKM
ncbi:hypothetical protein Btru_000173 [Bulinus truncatus]|nr:hypothetical protein Btru_000173 [Bulinus truncatus]